MTSHGKNTVFFTKKGGLFFLQGKTTVFFTTKTTVFFAFTKKDGLFYLKTTVTLMLKNYGIFTKTYGNIYTIKHGFFAEISCYYLFENKDGSIKK